MVKHQKVTKNTELGLDNSQDHQFQNHPIHHRIYILNIFKINKYTLF